MGLIQSIRKAFSLTTPHFAGSDYLPELDDKRLGRQLDRVFTLMGDGIWRTLQEISDKTGDPQASISAQLRHLRKPRFGSFIVDKRRKGEPHDGLWEYRLDPFSGHTAV